ncbi:hypothetical protein DL766_001746 [Monosporascus sp. MC13-8B]|uniref:Amine oxidase domain-containing protein n=1 Tax=Monosporascus cannonballus TaxID=155416 RepID=A0ABY0HIK6_9PEZI|nr:hypothetical protein DL762_001705 [Monosporascus cannonballus]RYO99425.1 hypothetical protein DL763_001449 [Monosporascus cannonballus]RYP36868.1 hypothetical protein DL766_001746 [Monosporascus sp. MC13-8B]
MDAHSLSFTSASQRTSSRIWKDLTSCRLQSTLARNPGEMLDQPTLVNKIGKRRAEIYHRKPHVAVIGAGLAGLRPGGRVHQETLPSGHIVDAGPNWIHGTNNNPILDLAKETDTATGSWDNRTYVLDENEDAFRHSNKHCATISPSESLWDFFQNEVARRIPDTEPDFERERDMVFKIAESWGAFVGSHIFTQSLKYFWLEECIEGENLFCAGTYKKILERIAKPALEGAVIRYETVVTSIQSSSDDGGQLKVLTRGGESFKFDEVVVTAPLGWLKQHHTEAFSPPLPARLTKAIENIGYGSLEKVYISFPEAFWLTSDSKERRVQGFCQWLAPNYAPESNPHKWNQEMVELASLTPETSHPILLFYTYGDQSRYLTGELARLPTKEKREAFLYAWFRPYYSRLPRYEEGASACKPTGCFATAWLADELAGNGSYSNFQVGLEEGDADIETMREGLPDRGLWLAGEHTAPFVALGTATGAYWSGESVASRIAKAYCREEGGITVLN